jgi:NAD(P)-dependent dehydrogenase (short-subunit alcohol dehydrogenase family)
MDLGLKDKVVVITGGTAGIGEACALAFSREGAHVAVCGRTQKRIAAFKERCAQAGADVFVKQADAGQAEELQVRLSAALARLTYGSIMPASMSASGSWKSRRKTGSKPLPSICRVYSSERKLQPGLWAKRGALFSMHLPLHPSFRL